MAKTTKQPTKPVAAAAKKAVATVEHKQAELNPKQLLFVKEYLKDLSGVEAVLRAGYKMSVRSAGAHAARLLADGRIAALVQAGMDRRAEKCDITAADILESIVEVRERCLQKVPVMRRVDGKLVQKIEDGHGVWEFDSRGALKANELLGKHLKLFTDRVEIDGNVSLTVVTGVPDGDAL